jgi:cysteine desulfurase
MNAPQDLPQQPVPMFSPKHFPVYMDYSATTPIDPRVCGQICATFATSKLVTAASRSHAYGWAAEGGRDGRVRKWRQLVHADPREIVFTSGATESINLALKGACPFLQGSR